MGSLCYSRFFLLGALGNAIKFRGGSDLLLCPPDILCERVCTQEQLVITDETDVPYLVIDYSQKRFGYSGFCARVRAFAAEKID